MRNKLLEMEYFDTYYYAHVVKNTLEEPVLFLRSLDEDLQYLQDANSLEKEIDRQLLALFETIQLDAEAREWFVNVIKALAKSGQHDNCQQNAELTRQHQQVEASSTR